MGKRRRQDVSISRGAQRRGEAIVSFRVTRYCLHALELGNVTSLAPRCVSTGRQDGVEGKGGKQSPIDVCFVGV